MWGRVGTFLCGLICAALAPLGGSLCFAAVALADHAGPPPPSAAQCAEARANRTLAPIVSYDPKPGSVRVFAMQFKQELRNVATYQSFRTKIECMILDDVVPHLAAGRPNLVVFNEDIGLMTLATGTRGAVARALFANPQLEPSCESQGLPCGTAAAFVAASAAYAGPIAYYQAKFGGVPSIARTFVAATDTFVRGWMQTFSDMARRYGIYIVGSNTQAPFSESRDRIAIAALHDPDYPPPASVYVATEPAAYNTAFMWGPHDVRRTGPAPLRNVVASNRKLPLTATENEFQFSPGPSSGPAAVANLAPYQIPGTQARVGFATSLPAFTYGTPPPGTDPCSDVSQYYMRCLNELGANLVLQDEANDGRWAADSGCGSTCWQPLDWMGSAWRGVTDPSVGFDYVVNPMMTGNLADLVFDGQSSITQRGIIGASCNYVGNATFEPGDPASEQPYAGAKPQFLEMARWVSPAGSRADLKAVAGKLAPGSHDPLENDYVETALVADLPFPPDPRRATCLTAPGTVSGHPGG